MKKNCLELTKNFSFFCFAVMVIIGCLCSGQAGAANGNEGKIKSKGGYTGLRAKSLGKGSVKIIIQVRAPLTPESMMQENDKMVQRSLNRQIQDQVINEIEGRGHKPGRVRKYKYVPHIAMTVDGATLDALLSSQDVVSIEEDTPVPPTLDQSVPRVGALQLHEKDITGAGVAVVVLDTGVDKTHPFLQGSVISEACYSTDDVSYGSTSLCPGGVTESLAEGSAMPYGGSCPPGECDHGTHVAGIVAGRSGIPNSPGPGVAPEASIIAIQVFSQFNSYDDCGGPPPCIMSWSSDQLQALERAYELSNTYRIASVNMSLGGGAYSSPCDGNSLQPSIKLLRDNGIATVISSGNDGYCGYISSPACSPLAISVGATDDADAVAYYSNSAFFLSILAPGQWIASSVPGGIYQSWSGTSMAAPHVAGAWALMKQTNPAATVEEILSSFTSTGLSVTDDYCPTVIKKRMNVYEAFSLMSDYASLAIVKRGAGLGTITSSPSGIVCGQDCSEFFTKDSVITLTAIADPGSVFGGWNGGGCSTTDTCQITLSTSSSVTALFRKEASFGTEFIITGYGFGKKTGTVLIGDAPAKILQGGWNNDSIAVMVRQIPADAPGIFSLTVIPRDHGSVPVYVEDAIMVKGPQISLSDYRGVPGYPILIQGKFFGTKKQKVFLEYTDEQGLRRQRRCRVPSWYMDKTTGDSKLVFITPKNLPPGAYTLKVTNRVGTGESPFIIEPSQ